MTYPVAVITEWVLGQFNRGDRYLCEVMQVKVFIYETLKGALHIHPPVLNFHKIVVYAN